MLHHLLADAVVLIVASLAFVALFAKLRLSSIAGYLFAGALVGHMGCIWSPRTRAPVSWVSSASPH